MPQQIIQEAVAVLRAGEVVGMPTETVYGLAGDARNPSALARIYAIKQRPEFDPLILHAATFEKVFEAVDTFPQKARALAEVFWPGPLTLILPKKSWVPDLATSGLPSVAVRVPAHPVAQTLLRKFDGFLAAPSANKFGRISPTTAGAVRAELGGEVPIVLDGGPCSCGIESTIVSFLEPEPRVLRWGALTLEQMEPVIGRIAFQEKADPRLAPGNIASHYAPRTPLKLWQETDPVETGLRIGLLALRVRPMDTPQRVGFAKRFHALRLLSPGGDLEEAAARFFQALRELDALGLDGIYAVPFPEHGLGRALNDRLCRAAHGTRVP
ncbi:MAG: L-threonylcarbamoyladenylate synthase [Verrucomicrobiae bacterium]|nr:L-threonylcarbamoyladenylate synthase [Verrucomicrobiae bacterium]